MPDRRLPPRRRRMNWSNSAARPPPPSMPCWPMPWPRCASGWWSKVSRSPGCSTANSAPPMGWPGSPPMSKRCASSPPTPSGWRMPARSARSRKIVVRIALGEYLAQIVGGIPMSQGEMVRPSDLGLSAAQVASRINRRCRKLDRQRQYRGAARPTGRADARKPRRDRRRLRPRRHAGIDPRGDAQIRRQRSDRPRAEAGTAPTATSRWRSSRRCPSSACSGSPSRKNSAAWGSARSRCASCRRNCRAAISASARSARARRSPPN